MRRSVMTTRPITSYLCLLLLLRLLTEVHSFTSGGGFPRVPRVPRTSVVHDHAGVAAVAKPPRLVQRYFATSLVANDENDDDTDTDTDRALLERDIFVFCDGTWCGERTRTRTNIRLLYEFVRETCGAAHCAYFEGVGMESSELNYFWSGAFGTSYGKKILEAYKYIVQEYDANASDAGPQQIWLFGLSRGAYTVRYVAGMIDRMGIVDKSRVTDIDAECQKVLDDYVSGRFNSSGRIYRTPLVKFMGLLDTVQAEGLPNPSAEQFPYPFSNPFVGLAVQNVYQSTCIHDRFKFFQPCTIARDPDIIFPSDYHTEEVWTPGCHYDVGRQFFRVGRGVFTDLLRISFRFNPLLFFRPLPDVAPMEEYADFALNWLVEKMEANGFPDPTKYPLYVSNAPDEGRNPSWWPLPAPLWKGDVYDRLLKRYGLVRYFVEAFDVYPFTDRTSVPKDFVVIDVDQPSQDQYPSKALSTHKDKYPGGNITLVPVPKQYEIPKRINI